MTIVIDHKRGDSFRLIGNELVDDVEQPIDISGYEIRSQVRTKCGHLVADLEVLKAPDGLSYDIQALDTQQWPVSELECDIEYRDLNQYLFSTDTFIIKMEGDVTQ